MADIESPAEVYERYLGRAIADPFTRVLLDCAGPRPGERVLDLAAGTGSVARHVAPIVGTEGRVVAEVDQDQGNCRPTAFRSPWSATG